MNSVSDLTNVDKEIYNCLNIDNPKSFFLFAGAGSGKTRSLVEVLKIFRIENSKRLKLYGQRIAIITYTNAACDEIKSRIEFDSTFSVSTIHSFAWELIKPFQYDIKIWIQENSKSDIEQLEIEQSKGRPGTKISVIRENQIKSKLDRLARLDTIKKFTYNPNGNNDSKDSLSHSEVIKIAADLITSKTLMQSILIKKYPILLIDESQDTKKEIIDAFFNVQSSNPKSFTLGLFGDMMQRIYADGKENLGNELPTDWAKPAKTVNYRCPKRIIKLINKIRSSVDEHKQEPFENNIEGCIRLFIINSNNQHEKSTLENNISKLMSGFTGDNSWEINSEIKILTLEHHMAASRGGFLDFFEPLYSIEKFKTGLMDGTLLGLSLFTQQVLPLKKAKLNKNEFEVAQIVKKYSPLLNPKNLKNTSDPLKDFRKAEDTVNKLLALWDNSANPSLIDVLNNIKASGLFIIPENFASMLAATNVKETMAESNSTVDNQVDGDSQKVKFEAWEKALNCSFSHFEAYANYISDKSQFGTHQGVKGLEFPRVMLIIDDAEARGFMFSYDKLFGTKELSRADLNNIDEGKEISIDRTRRLFYVTCSRAKESLAIVAYTDNPAALRHNVLKNEWFTDDEIIVM